MKYMLIAGETSGDLHASRLIASIRRLDGDARFRFIGGDMMAKESRREPDIHYKEMNVMGFSEVLRKLPTIRKCLNRAKQMILEWRPDVLILVDYPGFNLKVAQFAHKHGIRTEYYISPKVWAWKAWRVRTMRKCIDRVLSILPFENSFFEARDFRKVVYVGNPSVEEIDSALGHLPPLKHFMERQGITDTRPMIALLPGSRKGEIRNNLPLMLEAAKKYPDFQYIVAAAPAIPEKFYREVAQDPGLNVVFGSTTTLVKFSEAAIVTSGTATLETSLIGTPQVVCYRSNGSRLAYKIMEKLLKVKYVSLPNLIVGHAMVPELLVCYCTSEAIARELSPLLQPSPKRDRQVAACKTLRRKLGTFIAPDYAAELITEALGVTGD